MSLSRACLVVGIGLATAFGGSVSAQAQSLRQAGRVGVGVGSAWADFFSLKYFINGQTAIQATAGTYGAFEGNGEGVAAGVDYLIEMPVLVGNEHVEIGWAVGPGAGFAMVHDTLGVAVGAALGIELCLKAIPIDIAVEYRPALLVVPDVHFDAFDLGAHIRYYF